MSDSDSDSAFSCTLSRDELQDRGVAWKRVGAVLVDGAATEDGFRMRYEAVPGVSDLLRVLVAAERICCAWAEWTIIETDEHCTLDVTGPEDKIGMLAAAFGVLR